MVLTNILSNGKDEWQIKCFAFGVIQVPSDISKALAREGIKKSKQNNN